MSTTDQPAPEGRTIHEKAREVTAPFAAIAPAYRSNPIAHAAADAVLALNARVHALESVEVVTLEAVGCDGCSRGLLPEADEKEATIRRSTPEENRSADTETDRLRLRAAVAAADAAIEATRREDGTMPGGTVKQTLGARILALQLEHDKWRQGALAQEHRTVEEGKRAARAEQALRDAQLSERTTSAPAAVARVLAGARLSRDDARDIHDLVNSRTDGTAKQKLTERLERAERLLDEATQEAGRQMDRATALQSELNAMHGFTDEDAERLVYRRLVKDEEPAAREGGPKHLRTRLIPRTSMADLGRRFDEARKIPNHIAEEIIESELRMGARPYAAPSAPEPSPEPTAAAVEHDPILDEPERGLGTAPDPHAAATEQVRDGVAALLAHFGIDPEEQAPVPRAPFAFTERPDDGLDPREETPSERMNRVMGEAIGAASTCWPNMSGTGIFDEARAREILAALKGEVEVFLLHDRQAQREQQH